MNVQTISTETANNVKTINTNQLGAILSTITKSTTISLTYFVDESKSRQIGGAKQVQKRVKVNNLYLNHNYANKVNNLNGTTKFVAQELKGKERIC